MKLNPFFHLPFVALMLGLSSFVACSGSGVGGNKAPQGDGYGFGGIINVENARAVCQYKEKAKDSFEVLCEAAVMDPQGNLKRAIEVSTGITLNWKSPKQIAGSSQTSFQCETELHGLWQLCSVSISREAVASTIEFALQISEASSGKLKIETDTVVLPYSITSYGFIPQFRTFAQSEKSQTPTAIGFQVTGIKATELKMGSTRSVCQRGSKTFISTHEHIYAVENGIATLYAGSGNIANVNELSDRLRIALGNPSKPGAAPYGANLFCTDTQLYFSDTQNSRILLLQDSGPVVEVVSNAKTNLPFGLAVDKGGNLFYLDGRLGTLNKVDPLGKHSMIASGLRFPFGLTLVSESEWLVTQMGANKVSRINSVGSVTDLSTVEQPMGIGLNSVGETVVGSAKLGQLMLIRKDGSVSTLSAGHFIGGDLWIAPSGEIVFTDSGNHLALKLLNNGEKQVVAGLSSTRVATVGDTEASQSAQFPSIPGIAITSERSILIADPANRLVRKVLENSNSIEIIAGALKQKAESYSALKAYDAVLGSVQDLIQAADGTIYLSELGPARIRRMDPNGYLFTVANATAPSGLAFSKEGILHFTDGNSIYKIGPSNSILLVATGLVSPKGISLDAAGNIYVSEPSMHRIRMISLEGDISTVAGKGTAGFSGDDGPAIEAELNRPLGIYVTSDGSILVSDSENGRVRKFQPGSKISTLFGGSSKKDCGGSIVGTTTKETLESDLKASLSQICFGKPTAIKMVDNCAGSTKTQTYVFSQQFSQYSNIIRIEQPCSQ